MGVDVFTAAQTGGSLRVYGASFTRVKYKISRTGFGLFRRAFASGITLQCARPKMPQQGISCCRKFLIAFIILALIRYLYFTFEGEVDSSFAESKSYIILKSLPESNSRGARTSSFLAITGTALGGKYTGLGNQMFIYASLYGIGRELGLDAIIAYENAPGLKLLKDFANFTPSTAGLPKFFEGLSFPEAADKCCSYVNFTANLNGSFSLLIISGFLQSWKYFFKWRSEIVDLFKFDPEIVRQADSDFHRISSDSKSVHQACIHARRGDFLSTKNAARGYIGANFELVGSAIRFLNDTLKNVPFKILLFSDHPSWCQRKFEKYPITIIHKQKASVAMRMISSYCNSFVLTSSASTFAWWAAFLNQNATVYYNQQVAVRGSIIDQEIVRTDYFLPHWMSVNLTSEI